MNVKIRLYVKNQIRSAQIISLGRDQANYLISVMRQTVGDQIHIFNNFDGEWLAEIINANKRIVELKCLDKIRQSIVPPNVWLFFFTDQKVSHRFHCRKSDRTWSGRDISNT